MTQVLNEAPITTANARRKLERGIHWRGIDPDTHLGYRRGARGGRWLVRWYTGNGVYRQETIGTADDALAADGVQTLSFSQATRLARERVEQRRAEAAAKASGPEVTVRIATENYIAEREARERARLIVGAESDRYLRRDSRSRLTKHVLADAELAATTLRQLTEHQLTDWRDGLPRNMAPTTTQRLINDFKAALNRAAQVHRTKLPPNLPVTIKHGLAMPESTAGAIAREAQVLKDQEITQILSATQMIDAEGDWGGDLFRLVTVLAATGARFSQVIRMTVADVQPEQMRLMVPVSHKGSGSKAASRTAIRVGEDVLAVLDPAVAGRRRSDPLLLRPRWKQQSPTNWVQIGRAPWRSAVELTRPWSEIIKKAGLPADIVPYCLRHSSIVRGIRAGLPVRLVAALHDTSTAMIERHYSPYIVDALDELAGRAVVPLVPAPI